MYSHHCLEYVHTGVTKRIVLHTLIAIVRLQLELSHSSEHAGTKGRSDN